MRLRFLLTQIRYDLRKGFLLRPGVITAGLAALAFIVPAAEARLPILHRFAAAIAQPPEPAAAQMILATIAGSVMTVLSITYSALLMALSMASMQYSPRILAGFIGDRVSQTTLGAFVGTFTYCLILLAGIRSEPPFVPAMGVEVGLVLAITCLAWLLYFIHHIAYGIQANHIVDRIAEETESVIDDVFLWRDEAPPVSRTIPPPPPPAEASEVPAPSAGYVQLVDVDELLRLATEGGCTIHVHRAPGEFVVAGASLAAITPREKVTHVLAHDVAAAFDLGPVRTMQQDVEFGVRQIVDVALKAISPAINDPSTANTCIDHLTRLLARIATRPDPRARLADASGTVHLVFRTTTFERVLDLALNQLRQYARGDMAVTLRLVRALAEVARFTHDRERLAALRKQAELVTVGCSAAFLDADREELVSRKDALDQLLVEKTAAAS
jgi:uncharacterized membrane protein